jgi:GT2 family glycosyltransferase
MYLCHVLCVRRKLFEELGGFRTGFEGCQDYDLALRASERARRVVHIPKILYHWRAISGSTASTGAEKPETFARGIRTVQEALQRRGIVGEASRPSLAVKAHHRIYHIDFPDDGPSVTILIPTKNQVKHLRRCVRSILKRTRYRNYRIVIIDNESDDPQTLAYLRNLPSGCQVLRIGNEDGRFNYARINNQAVRQVRSDFVLFLNNDTEVRSPEWLSQLVGYGRIAGVGAVGAKLLYPNGTLQHAGVVTGLGGIAGHIFKQLHHTDPGYMWFPMTARNWSVVTAACMLVRRQVFEQMGGFDEQRFAVAYNDVDFCLRLRERGLRCVYAPRAELFHYEGISRGRVDNPLELRNIRRAWGSDRDPYYNPNLSLDYEKLEISSRRCLSSTQFRQPIKVLLCTHNLNFEGGALSLFDLCLGLKQRGRVVPALYSPEDGPLAERFRQAGIEVHVFPVPLRHPDLGPSSLEDLEETVAAVAALASKRRCEVVWANSLMSSYAILAAERVRLPAVWAVRESLHWFALFKKYGRELIKPILHAFPQAYRVIFLCQATQALFDGLKSQRNFSVVRSGLRREPIDQFMAEHSQQQAKEIVGCPPDKLMVSTIGTVCERKGQCDFVAAATEILRDGRNDIVFYIVGGRGGSYQQAVEQLIRPFSDRIRLVPETDNVMPYYRASDISVLCSYRESFPRVIQESMAFGLPILTTPVGGIAEMVGEGRSALTFSQGNIQALTHCIRRLIDDPRMRTQLAQGAHAALEQYHPYEQMVQACEEILLEAYMTGSPTIRIPAVNSAKKVA